MRAKLTLRNNFHGTTARLMPRADGTVSLDAARRVRRALCPFSDCSCGNVLGARGDNPRVELIVLDGRPARLYIPSYDQRLWAKP